MHQSVGVKYTPIVFEDVNATLLPIKAAANITADRSALVSQRSVFKDPNNHVLLDVCNVKAFSASC